MKTLQQKIKLAQRTNEKHVLRIIKIVSSDTNKGFWQTHLFSHAMCNAMKRLEVKGKIYFSKPKGGYVIRNVFNGHIRIHPVLIEQINFVYADILRSFKGE